MKKLIFFACLLALILGSCSEKKAPQPVVDTAQTDSLSKIIEQKDNELNDMMGTLNEIQEGFREINEAENRVTIAKDGERADKRQQIREDIQFISKQMARNRELISKLREQLRQSSIKGDQFKRSNRFFVAVPQAIGRVRLASADDELLNEHVSAWCEAHRAD